MAVGELKFAVNAVVVSGDPIYVNFTPVTAAVAAGDIIVYVDSTATPTKWSPPMVCMSPCAINTEGAFAVGNMVLDVNNAGDDAVLGQVVYLDVTDTDDTILAPGTGDVYLGVALEASGGTTTDRVRVVTIPEAVVGS